MLLTVSTNSGKGWCQTKEPPSLHYIIITFPKEVCMNVNNLVKENLNTLLCQWKSIYLEVLALSPKQLLMCINIINTLSLFG